MKKNLEKVKKIKKKKLNKVISQLFKDIYEVELLLDERTKNGKKEYLVKWKNYSLDSSTWEPEENILHEKIIKDYEKLKAEVEMDHRIYELAKKKRRMDSIYSTM